MKLQFLMNNKCFNFKNSDLISNFKFQISNSFLKERGFTFVEFILVVALILILSGMSTSFYSRFLTQNAVATTSDQLAGQIRKAQMYAMAGRQNNNWGVHYQSNTITLYQGSSFGATPAFNETFSVYSSVTISGFTDINFTKTTGLPNSTPTITISDPNSTSKTIVVNTNGMVDKQ